jgi:hypothetical protein
MRLNTYVFRQSRKGRNREQEKAKLLYFPTRDIRQAESRLHASGALDSRTGRYANEGELSSVSNGK